MKHETDDASLCCEDNCVHGERLAAARLPEEGAILDLADFFRIFGDSTRIKILCALDSGELCVCDIAALLGMSMSAVSHQLRTLRDADLVRSRREGKTIFYSLADEHVRSIIDCGLEHIEEEA